MSRFVTVTMLSLSLAADGSRREESPRGESPIRAYVYKARSYSSSETADVAQTSDDAR